jgi:hypothetical protein
LRSKVIWKHTMICIMNTLFHVQYNG